MSDDADTKHNPGAARSVQSYIDERPLWTDGTNVSWTPMTAMQWRIWMLAAFGKFFEGLIVFMTGVAMPLLAREFDMTAVQHGIVGASSLAGILIGASALGGLADRFGRRRIFIAEMVIFVAFLFLVCVSPSYWWLVICLFGVGIALGCDYPTAHLIISESTPSSIRGRLVLGAFGFQALGALMGTLVGWLVLSNLPQISAWRWMFATTIVPAVIVAVFRFTITESAQWQIHRGHAEAASLTVQRLLARQPPYPRTVNLTASPAATTFATGYAALFKGRTLRATIFASVPWFLQDLGTYGIGIFTPTILAASFGHSNAHATNLAGLIGNGIVAAKGSAAIDLLLVAGIVVAVLLVDQVGRIKLQIVGFVGCAIGLFMASLSVGADPRYSLAYTFAGFMLFNLMTNLGPNAQTYLIAGEVFPTAIRAKGAGFAASVAKIGAVLTAFLFPVLLKDIGTRPLLYILIATSLAGAAVTWMFRIETTRVDLESGKQLTDA